MRAEIFSFFSSEIDSDKRKLINCEKINVKYMCI